MQTVFFGPFVGEFGWEVMHWQGWVRKLCQGEFKNYRKIVCSYPGRQPFYPDADEFWPLSPEFLALKTSAHSYFTDCWLGGYPGKQYWSYTYQTLRTGLRTLKKPLKVPRDRKIRNVPDVSQYAEAMLEECKKKLPKDTVFFVPWKENEYKGLKFGMKFNGVPKAGTYQCRRIDFEEQLIEPLAPTPAGKKEFDQLCPEGEKLFAIFPRHRRLRRPDKNWPREKYLALIDALKVKWPDHKITVLGEPGGAHFDDGVPPGCIDLINIAPEKRMDLQLAALQRATFCLGSMSGALIFGMAAGCPALIWGHLNELHRYHYENLTGTSMIYYPSINPSLEMVMILADALNKNVSWTNRHSKELDRVLSVSTNESVPPFHEPYSLRHDAERAPARDV